MVTKKFENKSFMQVMRRFLTHSGWAQFFFFWAESRWRDFLLFSLFPSYSHRFLQVPKLFPQDIPNNTSVLPHIICPKFKSHVYELKRCTIVKHSCFYLRLGVQRGASVRESRMCFKSIDDRPIKYGSFQK